MKLKNIKIMLLNYISLENGLEKLLVEVLGLNVLF